MILKMYIKKHLFHLPRKQDNLTEMIKEKFYQRKPLVKSGITKLYRISDIENNNIKYEKNVNIFLVNLYLLAMQHNGKLKSVEDIQITLSDGNIIEELSKILHAKLNDLSIEELEEKIDRHLNDKEVEKSDTETNDQNMKIEFNLNWVRKMNQKLKE